MATSIIGSMFWMSAAFPRKTILLCTLSFFAKARYVRGLSLPATIRHIDLVWGFLAARDIAFIKAAKPFNLKLFAANRKRIGLFISASWVLNGIFFRSISSSDGLICGRIFTPLGITVIR